MQNPKIDNQKIHHYNNLIKAVWYIFLFYLIIHIFWSVTMPQWITMPLHIDEVNTGEWISSDNKTHQLDVKRGELQVHLKSDISHQVFYLNALLNLIFLGVIGYIIYQVKSISEAIFLKNHFAKINAVRLQNIGKAIAVTAILYPMFQRFINTMAIKHINIPNLVFDKGLPFEWSYYFIGIIFLVIAKAFERGFELQEENALII